MTSRHGCWRIFCGRGAVLSRGHGGAYVSKPLIYVVDPMGRSESSPRRWDYSTSSDDGYDVTLGFPFRGATKGCEDVGNDHFPIPQQTIDVTIEKNGKMTGTVVSAVIAVQ